MTETAADEQDLARALDSVANATLTPAPATDAPSDDTTAGPVASPFGPPATAAISKQDDADASAPSSLPVPSSSPFGAPADHATEAEHITESGPLAAIKKDALVELRPLVDKLNVSPEEKFDTYLLLIRSTDDTALIAPAHDAAKAIEDETRRAEALLDIIKEIDYLSRPKES